MFCKALVTLTFASCLLDATNCDHRHAIGGEPSSDFNGATDWLRVRYHGSKEPPDSTRYRPDASRTRGNDGDEHKHTSYLSVEDFINAEQLVQQDIPEDQPDPIATSGKFEGDINLGLKGSIDFANVIGSVPGFDGNRIQNNAINGASKRWPNGKIPYKLTGSFSTYDRSVIASAINQYNERTCIRWIPRTNEADYVDFIIDGGCYSSVGRDGGAQTLSLGRGCVQKGIIVHEMMHSVGFFHEQSRTDRDDWVRVIWQNIIPGTEGNFQKLSSRQIDSLGVKYDYASVMHYGKGYFSRNGEPTIVPTRDPSARIGQRVGFSSIDIDKINKLYNCPSTEGRGSGSRATTPRPNPSGGCYNDNQHCEFWADQGECSRSEQYMSQYCRRACNRCSGGGTSRSGCSDDSRFCNFWAGNGECTNSADYMRLSCRRACKLCSFSPGSVGGGGSFRRRDF